MFDTPNENRARLQLIDSAGNRRVSLFTDDDYEAVSALVFAHTNKKPRLLLGMSGSSSPRIQFFDAKGRERILLLEKETMAGILLHGPSGKDGLTLAAAQRIRPQIEDEQTGQCAQSGQARIGNAGRCAPVSLRKRQAPEDVGRHAVTVLARNGPRVSRWPCSPEDGY